MNTDPRSASANYAGWQALVAKYQQPDLRLSIWQVVNSLGGFMLCWGLMVVSLDVGYWLTLLLSVPTAGFVIRTFIIQHDCGHGSFFKKRKSCDILGIACSFITTMPYVHWRKSHAIHHAHHAELEERGVGDLWTMTVDEYLEANTWKRALYRAFRNPFFLFIIAPSIKGFIMNRFTIGIPNHWRQGEKASVWWTNLALAGVWTVQITVVGWQAALMINLPIFMIAFSIGTWLFYVQHQFEHTYWEHTPRWDFTLAAMQGSSYYKLPYLLQWFTGNIGFHHIHHLSPRIPNYRLEQCHQENELFQRVIQLTFRSSLSTANLALWDEEQGRLITFRQAVQARQLTTTMV